MNESHFDEIERTLLLITGARERAGRAARLLGKDGAETHLVEALEAADGELLALHRRLMQATYFAVPGSRAAENQLASRTIPTSRTGGSSRSTERSQPARSTRPIRRGSSSTASAS